MPDVQSLLCNRVALRNSYICIMKMCLTKYFFNEILDFFIVVDRFTYDGGQYSYGDGER